MGRQSRPISKNISTRALVTVIDQLSDDIKKLMIHRIKGIVGELLPTVLENAGVENGVIIAVTRNDRQMIASLQAHYFVSKNCTY